ncbi:hypothetical protein HK097_011181 [Rhizophlyctis rosea]|uniref:Uncharacterized protein n=1 Tax=Rhizophlyctis rosea TaxID=64517 RepID=A0AAD5SLV9_9FUNG|nr:hypothetical protein HK097_011181 [Rhizophlyctis rosea]
MATVGPPLVDGSDITAEDGPRMRLLRKGYEKALDTCLGKCSYEGMAQAFPTLARDNPDALRGARDQLVQFIKTAALDEFELINEERSMQLKLNELDQLVESAQQKLRKEEESRANSEGVSVPEHRPVRLAPEAVIRIKTSAAKRQEVEKLKALLLETNNETERLLADLVAEHEFSTSVRQFVEEASGRIIPRETLLQFDQELALNRASDLEQEF